MKLYRPATHINRQLYRSISCITCSNHKIVTKSPFQSKTYLSRFPLQQNLSTSPSNYTDTPPIKQWEYRLTPFGKLVLNSSSIDCSVSPIDPNEYPEQDLVIVSLHGAKEGKGALSCENQGDDVHVSQLSNAQNNSLDIKVPIKYGEYFLCIMIQLDVSNKSLGIYKPYRTRTEH